MVIEKMHLFCLEKFVTNYCKSKCDNFKTEINKGDHVITAHVMIMWQSRDGSDCRKEGQVGSKGDQSDLKS